MDAGMFGKADDMKGVSSNVMLGQLCPFGTGSFGMMLDDELVRQAIPMAADAGDGALLALGAGAGPTPLMATPAGFSPAGTGVGASPIDGLLISPAGGWSPEGDAPTPAAFSPGGAFSPNALYGALYSPANVGVSPAYGGGAGKSPAFTPTDAASPSSPGCAFNAHSVATARRARGCDPPTAPATATLTKLETQTRPRAPRR